MDDRIEFLRKKIKRKGRIHILRLLIIRYYLDKKPELVSKAEAILDSQLRKYKFKVEKLISLWRKVSPPFVWIKNICKDCGYRAPFCGCGRSM
jgi:hypothetical protein